MTLECRLKILATLAVAVFSGACVTEPDPSAEIELVQRIRTPVAVGESVIFELELTNRSSTVRQVELGLGDFSYSPVVFDQSERTILWRPSVLLAGPGSSLRLRPGEPKTYSVGWDLRDFEGKLLTPGRYLVDSKFNTTTPLPPIRGDGMLVVTNP
jgi:hypothetical protein